MVLNEELKKEKEIRLKKIDRMISELGLDAIIFTSTSQVAYQVNVKYLANIPLSTRRAIAFKEKGGEPCLLLPMSGDRKTFPNNSWVETDGLYLGNMIPTAISLIEKLPMQKPRIGWASLDEIPYQIYNALIGTKAEFIDITRDYTALRSNKSEYEIAQTKLTSALSIESFEDLIRRMKPGMTEYQLIGGAIGFLAEHGAGDLLILGASKKPFATIKRPSNASLDDNGIFVYSAEFSGPSGYWTQIIRPVFMDRKTYPDAYEIWKVAQEAERAAVEVIHPGNRVCDIHYAIEAVIKKHGMVMSYWAGHGMGCDLGDGVDISPENDMLIVPNMVLTLQPSVNSDTNSLLYGNTFLSTEHGEAINLTGKYMDSPFFEDLHNEITR